MNASSIRRPIRPPFARYSHGVEVRPGAQARLLLGSTRRRRGRQGPGGRRNPGRALLRQYRGDPRRSPGLTLADIVRVNAYVTAREHMKGYMAVRDRDGRHPAAGLDA